MCNGSKIKNKVQNSNFGAPPWNLINFFQYINKPPPLFYSSFGGKCGSFSSFTCSGKESSGKKTVQVFYRLDALSIAQLTLSKH